MIEQFLVSSPGYGVVDSGCRKSIIGRETYAEFLDLWTDGGIAHPKLFNEVNHFRFGNGSKETSLESVKMPVVIGGRSGTIQVALVGGRAPLLISRNALKLLKARINFENGELTVFEDQVTVPLTTNSAGQFTIDLMGPVKDDAKVFDEVMTSTADESQHTIDRSAISEPVAQPAESESVAQPPSPGPEMLSPPVSKWSRVDKYLKWVPLTGKQGPGWHQVFRRTVTDLDTNEVIIDQDVDPKKDKRLYFTAIPKSTQTCRTEFWFHPQEAVCPLECMAVHHQRQLHAQVSSLAKTSYSQGSKLLVAEVFSPPRFAPIAKEFGFAGLSFDLKNGFDFRKKADRDRVAKLLDERPPELLVLSPPCTHEGGWHNLNQYRMDPNVVMQLQLQSRMFIKFCCKLFQQQVGKHGKRALFEHPSGARTWSYPEMLQLLKRHHWCKCHMCMFGLRVPGHNQLIRKSTGLLVSHSDMLGLGRQCPGKSHPDHSCHEVNAGRCAEVGAISTFAGQYSPMFVESVLQTVPSFAKKLQSLLVVVPEMDGLEAEALAASRADLQCTDDDKIQSALQKVHKNLGHPSNADLVRILKHGGANDRALELARSFNVLSARVRLNHMCRCQPRPIELFDLISASASM